MKNSAPEAALPPINLPYLGKPSFTLPNGWQEGIDAFTRVETRAYAREAVLADRAASALTQGEVWTFTADTVMQRSGGARPDLTTLRFLFKAGETLAGAQAPGAMAGLSIDQEPKYTVNGSAIVNRASGEAIPADEPVFIFRARDKYAASVIGDYSAQFCIDPAHQAAVEARFIQFSEWAEAHPERMKEPDTATPGADQ